LRSAVYPGSSTLEAVSKLFCPHLQTARRRGSPRFWIYAVAIFFIKSCSETEVSEQQPLKTVKSVDFVKKFTLFGRLLFAIAHSSICYDEWLICRNE
jgi:hypothetical protein